MAMGLPFSSSMPGKKCDPGGGGSCGIGGICYVGAGNGLPQDICFSSWVLTGSCKCLAGDQQVSLADGSAKLASEVRDGDLLLGMSEDGEIRAQEVHSRFTGIEPCLEIVHEGGTLVCSVSHVLFRSNREVATSSGLCPDEHSLLTHELGASRILSIRPLGAREVYGWTCEPDHTFIAAGLIHHNIKPVFEAPPAGVLEQ